MFISSSDCMWVMLSVP
uniref:Uncharacterized protein n=1 Tax=Anguilla anguilla TaxID=7936 RepID=A0A0E9P5H2_ANGAN